jgi:AcrR family transcriptional regulator
MARTRNEAAYEARRTEIMSHASDVFRTYGFEGSTLDQIAASMGQTKATIYYYFQSKEDLLFAVWDASVSQSLQAVQDIAASSKRSDQQLVEILQRHMEHLSTNFEIQGAVRDYLFRLDHPHARELRAKWREIVELLVSLVETAKSEGFIRDMDSRLVVSAILSSAQGVAEWIDGGEHSRIEATRIATDILCHGILTDSPCD